MKKLAILQSNYIPWKGYFDIIQSVDEFILYDDMQYTKRDWRNRNKIKTPDGMQWLTIPVETKEKFFQKINQTEVADHKWVDKHWKTIKYNYRKAPFFDNYELIFEEIYKKCIETSKLSEINYLFIKEICNILEIETKITWSSDYKLVDGKTERLVGLCKEAKADIYISGPAAKDYIDESLFTKENISLEWKSYFNYPEYNQLYGEFVHQVTVLDLIFNMGPSARNYITAGKKVYE